MKLYYCLLALLCPFVVSSQSVSVTGVVVDESGDPVPYVTITVINKRQSVRSDEQGIFRIERVSHSDSLVATAIGYIPWRQVLGSQTRLTIILKRHLGELKPVVVNTGYQRLPRERATGSFSQIDRQLLERSVGPNLVDRLENLAPGLLFNKAESQLMDPVTIRGRSTFYASAAPLIVLDNFPYEGDLSTINPDDIEQVSLLKDAAATSIWGARAGNGVIVLTSKKGKPGKPAISFTSSFQFMPAPHLDRIPRINSRDYIELEKFLFSKGYYNAALNPNNNAPFTPVVELLAAAANGLISNAEAEAQIENYKAYSILDESRQLYRTGLNRHYSASISGAGTTQRYYFSIGYDDNTSNLVGDRSRRYTVSSNTSFQLSERLEFTAGLRFILQNQHAGNNPGLTFLNNASGIGPYPYARLTDDAGKPAVFLREYRSSFVDNAAAAGFLNWQYKPLEDIDLEKDNSRLAAFQVQSGLKYRFLSWLSTELQYQHQREIQDNANEATGESFLVRNMVNRYTQVDPVSGAILRPLPTGGILDQRHRENKSNQVRLQFNISPQLNGQQLDLVAGAELREQRINDLAYRLYGYSPNGNYLYTSIDYSKSYNLSTSPSASAQIPNPASIGGTLDRFVSYYANGAYSYQDRYILSVSARQDASNLFGVDINDKGVPLWSAGAKWLASRESFYQVNWLPQLAFRVTYGLQGNISRRTSAYTTTGSDISQQTGLPNASIRNPANNRLSWERVAMLNLGVDFASKNQRIMGSVEFYWRKADNLMAAAPVDATWGLASIGGASSFFGNIAAMKGKGVDAQLDIRVIDQRFRWTSTLIGSYSVNQTTDYYMPASVALTGYLNDAVISPVPGRSLFSVYSFPWAGLDPQTGNPQGLVNKAVSTNYSTIYSGTRLDSGIYHGTSVAPYFGSIRNNIEYKQFSLSVLISVKAGHYFRRSSINYSTLFSTWTGHSDYANRWQQPGDEAHTQVPALVYPASTLRERFYTNAAVLVEKADHIRLEDINLAYTLIPKQKTVAFKSIRFYGYVRNLGLIWKANNKGVDPYYTKTTAGPASFAIGLTANF